MCVSLYSHSLHKQTHTFSRAIMTPKQDDSCSPAMKCVDTLWLHTVNAKVAWPWLLCNIKVIFSWMTVTHSKGIVVKNLIPDTVLCKRWHVQTTRALLSEGQFLLIWMTLVLCSGQRLCDFYLRLWCKIKRIVNRFHWCSSPVFSSPSSLQFRLQYNGLNNPDRPQNKKKKKGSPTFQRWHFNCCWADKNYVPPTSSSALWNQAEDNTLCLWMWFYKTEKGKMIQSDDVMSAASVNGRLKNTRS